MLKLTEEQLIRIWLLHVKLLCPQFILSSQTASLSLSLSLQLTLFISPPFTISHSFAWCLNSGSFISLSTTSFHVLLGHSSFVHIHSQSQNPSSTCDLCIAQRITFRGTLWNAYSKSTTLTLGEFKKRISLSSYTKWISWTANYQIRPPKFGKEPI